MEAMNVLSSTLCDLQKLQSSESLPTQNLSILPGSDRSMGDSLSAPAWNFEFSAGQNPPSASDKEQPQPQGDPSDTPADVTLPVYQLQLRLDVAARQSDQDQDETLTGIRLSPTESVEVASAGAPYDPMMAVASAAAAAASAAAAFAAEVEAPQDQSDARQVNAEMLRVANANVQLIARAVAEAEAAAEEAALREAQETSDKAVPSQEIKAEATNVQAEAKVSQPLQRHWKATSAFLQNAPSNLNLSPQGAELWSKVTSERRRISKLGTTSTAGASQGLAEDGLACLKTSAYFAPSASDAAGTFVAPAALAVGDSAGTLLHPGPLQDVCIAIGRGSYSASSSPPASLAGQPGWAALRDELAEVPPLPGTAQAAACESVAELQATDTVGESVTVAMPLPATNLPEDRFRRTEAVEDRRESERFAEELQALRGREADELERRVEVERAACNARERQLEEERQAFKDRELQLRERERNAEEDRRHRERQQSEERRAWLQVREEQRSWREERERLYSELRDAQHVASVARRIQQSTEVNAAPATIDKTWSPSAQVRTLSPSPSAPVPMTPPSSLAENAAQSASPQLRNSSEIATSVPAATCTDSLPTFGERVAASKSPVANGAPPVGELALPQGEDLHRLRKDIKSAMEALVRDEGQQDSEPAVAQPPVVDAVSPESLSGRSAASLSGGSATLAGRSPEAARFFAAAEAAASEVARPTINLGAASWENLRAPLDIRTVIQTPSVIDFPEEFHFDASLVTYEEPPSMEGSFSMPAEEAPLPEKLSVEESRRIVKGELEKLRQWYRTLH
jgi:hypothetical protein